MSVDLLALGAEMTPEQERRWILEHVGPGRYIIVVHKALRDAIMEMHQFKDEDVPGLITPAPFHVPPAETRKAPYLQTRPLPYPPRLKGRYAR